MGGIRGATWCGVKTVFRPAEVWANEGIYGFQNARWDTQAVGVFGHCGWGCGVRPPKYPGQVRIVLSFILHQAIHCWLVTSRDWRDVLTQGQN